MYAKVRITYLGLILPNDNFAKHFIIVLEMITVPDVK